MADRYLPVTSYRVCRPLPAWYRGSRLRRALVWVATWYGWLVVAVILAASAVGVVAAIVAAASFITSHTGR
jgi:hypothetical protein